LVADIRSALAPDPLAAGVFEDRLTDGGYLEPQAPGYGESGYTVRDVHFFRVEGSFPRIVEADLRPGVGAVRYSISAAECMHYRVDAATVFATISGADS
jgi:hypothetical protein